MSEKRILDDFEAYENTFTPELRSILDQFPSGLAVYRLIDGDCTSVYRNPMFYEIMGYSDDHVAMAQDGEVFLTLCEADRPILFAEVMEMVRNGGTLSHTLRIFHDRSKSYRWVNLKGARRKLEDGSALLFVAYTDVTGEKRLETDLLATNEKMQNLVNAIPGGVAIYRVTDIFETVYFSNGVPELTGYTVEEYHNLIKGDAAAMIYPEDTSMVVERLRRAIREHAETEFEFRKRHRDGHVVWVRIQARPMGEADGAPLIHCVFHNITDFKETQLEMNHLINSIPGGVASYLAEGGRLVPTFYSDGVAALSGYARDEFDMLIQADFLNVVYAGDRERVFLAVQAAMSSGQPLNISYRTRHKDGSLAWVHLNGRRIGPLTEKSQFYASITGSSAESRMYRKIADEAADAIYVIDRKNYEVLYFHESKKLFPDTGDRIGRQCYEVLQGLDGPCPFCNFREGVAGEDSEIISRWNGRTYHLHLQKTDWNGIPAFIQYLRDITEEVSVRREKQHLEQYFKTLVENLPGGVAVVRCQKDETFVAEFLSVGFADMIGLTLEQARDRYSHDALAGVHPEDLPQLRARLREIAMNIGHRYELTYRLQNGKGRYIRVCNTMSMLPGDDGDFRQYCCLQDITKKWQEQDHGRERYRKLILQHYRMPGPNALVVGHCNISRNRIIEINDYTDTSRIKSFGTDRESFFTGFSTLIVDTEERRRFLEMYLNAPMLKSFRRKDMERVFRCFIQLPGEKMGRHVQCKVTLVEEPDTGDITGILTVTDVTEQVVADQVLKQLSNTGYDHIVVLDLFSDTYTVFTSNPKACCVPPQSGNHIQWMNYLLENRILPKDRETYRKHLDSAYIPKKLAKDGAYSFDYSLTDDDGNIRVKRMTVFAIDLRLGKICLSRADVTETVREQQSFLNMLAYTFELATFIDVGTQRMIMHTRQTVLEDLPPFVMENYDEQVGSGMGCYDVAGQSLADIRRRFRMSTLLEQLEKQPLGYDFIYAYRGADSVQYKRINVLWGDRNHRTVCIVRADVTEILEEERKNKKDLETALALANQANQAKTSFLSSMSHDIRTPMNAIMGMTALASAHPDDSAYVMECLGKISASSKHLLNLINDVLDMSKIEHASIQLSRERISIQEMVQQVSTMILPQSEEKHQRFQTRVGELSHGSFYGDALRINQILTNVLGNAVKFTPEGGLVDFLVEERPAVKDGCVGYRFSIRDTGIGMSAEILSHVFEPFVRGTYVNRIEGTGLGLSIVKGLVDRMGGTISVESTVGKGSLFQIELEFDSTHEVRTLKTEETVRIQTATEDTQFLSGRRFLVAEDNAINAEIMGSLLGMYGAESVIKSDGLQTVETFSSSVPGTYDAVLMDIQMPVMNGYEASRAIRALERVDADTIPIIAMTANAFSDDVQAALDAGMNAHVAKPIEMKVLVTTLRRVILQNRPYGNDASALFGSASCQYATTRPCRHVL